MKYVLALIVTLLIATAAYSKSQWAGNYRMFCDRNSCSATAEYAHNNGVLSVVLFYNQKAAPILSVFYGSKDFRVVKHKKYRVDIHVNQNNEKVMTTMECSGGIVQGFHGFFCAEPVSFEALQGLRMWKSIGVNAGTTKLQTWYGLKGSAKAMDTLIDLFAELTPPPQGIEG